MNKLNIFFGKPEFFLEKRVKHASQKVLTTSPGVQLNILTYVQYYYKMMYGIFITTTK